MHSAALLTTALFTPPCRVNTHSRLCMCIPQQPRDASDITKTLASAATLTSTGSGRSIARTPSSRQGSRRPASRARPNTSSKLSVATHAEELNLDEQELRAAMTKTPTAHKPLYVKHL